MTGQPDVAFVPHILPLLAADPSLRAHGRTIWPLPVLLHKSPTVTRRLLIYVPGMVEGMPLTGRHDYVALGRALDQVGCSLMFMQMSVAQATEYTMFETCASDIHTVVEWAKAQGFTEIALAGISMGGPRVSYWNATCPDPAIKTIIFLATIESPYLSAARTWTKEEKARQDKILDVCRAAVAAGEPDKIIEGELLGLPMPLSAKVYISFLGQLNEMNASTVKFTDKVKVPTVLIHSTEDTIAPPESAKAIYDSLVNAPRRELKWIPNGDHQLLTTGRVAADTSRAVAEWVDDVLVR